MGWSLKVSAGKAGAFFLFLFALMCRWNFLEWRKARITLHSLYILLQIGDFTVNACVDLLTALEVALFVRTYAPRYIFIFTIHFFLLCLYRSYHLIHSSQAPKAVRAWKSELASKKRTKITAIVADPSSIIWRGMGGMLACEETHGKLLFLRPESVVLCWLYFLVLVDVAR